MCENIRLAFLGVWSHKMRSFLTMLGIIIGIASIIAIVSTIQGTKEQIKQNLVGNGNNTVKVELFQDEYNYEMEYNGIPDGVPVISEDILMQITDIEGIENASLYTSRQGYDSVFYKNTSLSGGYVVGIDKNYFNTCSYVIKEGRGFDEKDYTKFRKVAILDENCANSLFQGEDPLGKTIEIKGEPFTVIGISTQTETFEPVINTIDDYYTYTQDNSGRVYIPFSAWPIVYSYDEPQNLVIKAADTDSMARTGQTAADILNANLTTSNDTIKYKGQNLLEQAKDIQKLSQSTNRMLILIAAISLLVGGIGVMNIMLVSVTERTQEIGLKKSIGAQKKHILGQFLTEAAVLTSLGGIIGVVVGIILAKIVSILINTPMTLYAPSIVVAVVFSTIIGLVFGLLPSYKAANLKPIEALQTVN